MGVLNWNQTGALSFGATVLMTMLMILCYALDSWEVITYDRTSLQNTMLSEGLTVSAHQDYYVITLNSTIMIGNDTVAERLVLAETLKAGMWQSCSITNTDMSNLVNNSPNVDWATDICTYYQPMGTSRHLHGSGKYIRHVMTRTAQSCMIVSCICIFATLTLGTASLVIKHAILSMIASTVCAAAAMYQMLSMALMIKRQVEAKQHLTIEAIPVSLEDAMNVRFGTSTYLSIVCQILGLISVALWITHTKTLRGAIKLYIAENKYNLFCRM